MKRILVVGDDRDAPNELPALLQSAGCTVESAVGECETWEKLRGVPPDAVFLNDVAVGRGRDFIDACQERAAWAHIPIAVVSTRMRAAEARLLPAHAYLTSPFGLPSFMEAIEYVAQIPPSRTVRIIQPGPPSRTRIHAS